MVKTNLIIKRINPNEFGALMFDEKEEESIIKILNKKKFFRYSSKDLVVADIFEKMVQDKFDVGYALGLNNGTSALKVALHALGIKSKSRVLVSAYTFIATAAAVVHMGAIPIPIDFNFETGMDLKHLEKELKRGAKAIIPVHLQGRCFDLLEVVNLSKKYDVPVIEDACQAFGATNNNNYAGCFGQIGVFSFQQNKQISSGEGGLLITNDEELYTRSKIFADHGIIRESMSWDENEAQIGDNYRINNFQAAILVEQMKKIDKMIQLQKKHRNYLIKKASLNTLKNVINSTDMSGETGMNIFFLFNSKNDADNAIVHAKQEKVELRKLWTKPFYQLEVFSEHKKKFKYLECLSAEEIASKLLSLSIPPVIEKKYLDIMADEIISLVKLGLIS